MSDDILRQVGAYYTEKITQHGATPQGVDWNSTQSQEIRFAQLLKIVPDPGNPFSLLDYGCGYGGLIPYMQAQGHVFNPYIGFDISEAMLSEARTRHAGEENCQFVSDAANLHPVDFVVASGIFNVRLEHTDEAWQAYIVETLHTFDRLSRRGFAFNILTRYSDPEYMRAYLYYADPLWFFDYCKRHFSRQVALLHDYELYEFTLLVRKA